MVADLPARPRYPTKATVERLAKAARAAGIDTSRCAVEFTRDGTVRFVPATEIPRDDFERWEAAL